jgi:predicted CoA-substrate-specific enzyme activase
MNQFYKVGIDIGSTTAKIVFIDNDNIVFSDYQRHNADILNSLSTSFLKAENELGDANISVLITGSAGMGVSEKFHIPFKQEVLAAAEVIKQKYHDIKTLIDIGGEDAKMIFFEEGKVPDIRMNGSCAGGTGAFIDQVASLLGIEALEINTLATNYKNIYPIASRCGVFTKTDIQNLIAKNVSREDIAASVFNAVAMQTITSLARGYDIKPKVFFCGGPLTFLTELPKFFMSKLNLKEEDCVMSEHSQYIPALGCAMYEPTGNEKRLETKLSDFLDLIQNYGGFKTENYTERLDILFNNENDFNTWNTEKEKHKIKILDVSEINSNDKFYCGIDSGSTTTKIVVINSNEEIVFSYYNKNNGKPLEAVVTGFSQFQQELDKVGKEIKITKSAVTGYGEDLVKTAFNIDYGIVETIAHYTAARKFKDKVSFILDIGGQDMKAIFVDNGAINRLEVNEACSSGCGSFIEGFANSLKYSVSDFANSACFATHPCDLGTRCTVFMNSKVKQFLREGATVADIAAGLAYSVVKNCLYKVLKIKNISELGNSIVVQGGTFRNRSIIKALEKLVEQNVICSNIPELMGGYGAALYACRT